MLTVLGLWGRLYRVAKAIPGKRANKKSSFNQNFMKPPFCVAYPSCVSFFVFVALTESGTKIKINMLKSK